MAGGLASEVIEYGSRLAFIWSLGETYPELLTTLREQVFMPYLPHWGCLREGAPQASHGQALNALTQWAERFNIRDAWLMEACVVTIRNWVSGGKFDGRWSCDTPLKIRPFNPTFAGAGWLPVGLWSMAREKFRQEMTARFNDQLGAYLDAVELEWGAGKDQLEEHAKWTALRFRGLNYEEIARRCRLAPQSKDQHEAVRKAVHRFAKRIALTLHSTNRTPKP
jgi:hypothetical protein